MVINEKKEFIKIKNGNMVIKIYNGKTKSF